MDTCNKISKYMNRIGYDCRVIGVPKTIDNDLAGTDHCPGFASAAKYIATSIMEISRDSQVYDTGMVTIIECMGRHAGWLTAAAALANIKNDGPDLIYLPEVDFNMDNFIADIKRVYGEKKNCIVAVSEGVHYADGTFVSEAKTSGTDGFGHAQLGGLAARLADVVKDRHRRQGSSDRTVPAAALRCTLRFRHRYCRVLPVRQNGCRSRGRRSHRQDGRLYVHPRRKRLSLRDRAL